MNAAFCNASSWIRQGNRVNNGGENFCSFLNPKGVIARSEATRRSRIEPQKLDGFASLAMTPRKTFAFTPDMLHPISLMDEASRQRHAW
jgi:hypothetical protein